MSTVRLAVVNRSYRRAALALIAIGLILLVAACGDDGATSTPTSNGDPTPADGTSPDPTGTTDSSLPPIAQDVQALSQTFVDGVDGKVVYAYTSENVGIHPQGTWTTYRSGDHRREDWINRPFNFDSITIAAATDQEYVVCSGIPLDYACNASTLADVESVFGLFSPIREVYEALAHGIDSAEISELPDESLAGVTATCYQVDSDRIGPHRTGTETIKTCFAKDATVLFLHRYLTFDDPNVDDAELTLEATEVGSVSAADFDLLSGS